MWLFKLSNHEPARHSADFLCLLMYAVQHLHVRFKDKILGLTFPPQWTFANVCCSCHFLLLGAIITLKKLNGGTSKRENQKNIKLISKCIARFKKRYYLQRIKQTPENNSSKKRRSRTPQTIPWLWLVHVSFSLPQKSGSHERRVHYFPVYPAEPLRPHSATFALAQPHSEKRTTARKLIQKLQKEFF